MGLEATKYGLSNMEGMQEMLASLGVPDPQMGKMQESPPIAISWLPF